MKLLPSPAGLLLAAFVCLLPACAPQLPGTRDYKAFPPVFGPPEHVSFSAIAVQPDGKIVLGGSFTAADLQSPRNLLRLRPACDLDLAFQVGTQPNVGTDQPVTCLAVLDDGKTLVGGRFNTVAGQPRTRLARLLPDGSPDPAFVTDIVGESVNCLAVQADGRIVLAGSFTSVNAVPRLGLARLEPDGSLDTSFVPATTAPDQIVAIALQDDGQILASGNDASTICVRRFTASGALDPTFLVRADDPIFCLAVQADGNILLGGLFTRVNGQNRTALARVAPDGLLGSFSSSEFVPGNVVISLALSADGRMVVGGALPTPGGLVLFPDGTRDFSTGGGVVALQADGLILTGVGDVFDRYLNTPANSAFRRTGSHLTWERGGSAPEVGQVRFEISSDNGATWTLLGPAQREAGDWAIEVPSLPSSGLLRVRGRASGGFYNGSSSLHQEILSLNPPDTFLTAGPVGTTPNTTATFGYSASVPPLHFTYSLDGGTPVQTTATSVVLPGLAPGTHTFSVYVTDLNGTADSTPAIRTWTVDPNFPIAGQLVGGASPQFSGFFATTIAQQPDGKLIVAGGFTTVDGQSRPNIARLLPDGSLESLATFDPGTGLPFFQAANALLVQPDGKIILGGDFTSFNGTARPSLARLLPNGALEIFGDFIASTNGFVNAIVQRPDGRILVAGGFNTANNETRKNLALFTNQGILEPLTVFDVGTGPNGNVSCMALQPDGKIIIGGLSNGGFNMVNGTTRNRLARLHADGSLDLAFQPQTLPTDTITAVLVQPDGKILAAGSLHSNAKGPSRGIARFLPDGTEDPTFTPGSGPNGSGTRSILVQADGRIIVLGTFSSVSGTSRRGLARLHPNGMLEATDTFANPVITGSVYAGVQQPDGKIAFVGDFQIVSGQNRAFFARLTNEAALHELAQPASGLLRWNRAGSAPEVELATFEYSANGGQSWSVLGPGTRTGSDWVLAQTLPTSGLFRVRGRSACKTGNPSLLEDQLTVLSALEQWRAAEFGADAGNPALAANAVDPDADGAPNLFEYFAGSNPRDFRGTPQHAWSVQGGLPVLRYERRAFTPGVVFGVEQSFDLATWAEVPISERVIADLGNGRVTVEATVMATPGQPRHFLRAKLTVVP